MESTVKLNDTEVSILKVVTQDAMDADRRAREAIALVMRARGLEGVYALSKDCSELTLTEQQS